MSNTAKYLLGLDGGGTKTIARLIQVDSGQEWSAKCGATSLTNNFALAVENIAKICNTLFAQAHCAPENVYAVLGLAGACNEKVKNTLEATLPLHFCHVEVVTDAKTSLYGANMGKPIAVVALGTGSVGMRLLDDNTEVLVGGWGFVHGDEGGGAQLGLMAVKQLMHEIDANNQHHCPLGQYLSKQLGQDRQSLQQWLAKSTPTDFATLTEAIFALKTHCEVANNVLARHAENVEKLISMTVSDTNLPLVLMGGLAKPTIGLLSKTVVGSMVDAKGDSLDGACLLALQNYQRMNGDGLTSYAQ
ncbi:ATPase, BadF/BadG/BcrA/BcrD type [Alteromonas sp. 38]|uniref:BadF/BadG/BcrA/BcrD ATPase family protein n=1 Tax=unclassified Alteromonas TaxID=2614992 RepID=UPI0012EF6698|nr:MULTISPECIES: BadF/BadG/BcrA/BcrD ATPase family protein [unclassified Alteromonas]CAD5285038.1 ATPase, BadF/BadG/BcrA/BcrD type [Alteromonas sp. 154]VXB39738.1 ATPase, BadF/BadG/BcrA/BcrD type [Alteromonas sp. 38]